MTDRFEVATSPEDDPTAIGGARLVPAPWKPPAEITAEMVEAAKRRADALARGLDMLPRHDTARSWLGQLFALTKQTQGSYSPGIADLYANVLGEFPAPCWTDDSLRRAAARYEWMPSAAELMEHMRSELDRYRTELIRLGVLIETGVRAAPPKPPSLEEMRAARWARQDEQNERIRARLAEMDAKAPPEAQEGDGMVSVGRAAQNAFKASVRAPGGSETGGE